MKLWLILFARVAMGTTTEPLSIAADYYYNHHDFGQAYSLWSEVAKREPRNVTARMKVLELELLTKGHAELAENVAGFFSSNPTLSERERDRVREHLKTLQETFLSDEGQSHYLQAIPKIGHNDFAGALKHLTQAWSLERGNLLVLKKKAAVEKNLLYWERHYETLKSAYEVCPYDREVIEALADAHIYFANYEGALSLLKGDADRALTPKERFSYAFSLMETGRDSEALNFFRSSHEDRKRANSQALLYALGKIYLRRPGFEVVGKGYWEKFLAASRTTGDSAWDPFRLSERRPEVEKRLVGLESKK